MSKRGRRRHAKGPAFVQLYWHLLDSRAWHLLSLGARAAYLEVARLYDGTNNGRLGMSARRLAGLLPCNKDTAGRRLRELEHAGFLELVKIGSFNRRAIERKASEYRLTCFRCDITGDPPSRKFDPNVRWEIERPKPSDANVCPFRTFNAENRPNVRRNRTLKPSERPTKPDTNVRRNNTHIDLPPFGTQLDAPIRRSTQRHCHAAGRGSVSTRALSALSRLKASWFPSSITPCPAPTPSVRPFARCTDGTSGSVATASKTKQMKG